jgi:SAM-dependent methyltransferase
VPGDMLNLAYFVEWGGRCWQDLLRIALSEFLDEGLEGRRVLEIGAGSGRMSCLFALLGGNVTGIDTSADFVAGAKAEATKWGVQDRTTFLSYDGNLDILGDLTFDVAFTKSVLVVVPNLEGFLTKVAAKLKPGGKAVFLENARGNFLVHALRRFRHREWDWRQAAFFTQRELSMIKRVFEVKFVRKCAFPPVYLLCARKKNA